MSNSELKGAVAKWRLLVEDWQYKDPECVPVIKEIVQCLENQCKDILKDFDINKVPEYASRIIKSASHIEEYIGQEDSDVREALFVIIEDSTEYSYADILDSWLSEKPKGLPDDLVNVIEQVIEKGKNGLEILGDIPGFIKPIDKESEVFEWVDRKVTEKIKSIQKRIGLQKFYLIVDNAAKKAKFVEKPKGFNCHQISNSPEGKINMLNNLKIDGVHDVFSESQITACVLTYINMR